MNQKTIWQHFSSLPPEAQQQVLDFMAFLQARQAIAPPSQPANPTPLAKEAFVGMWQQREDLADSTDWVRKTRTAEWGKP